MDTRSDKFRKAMTVAKKFDLTREDRLDLAEYLLRRDVQSWTNLTVSQLDRLLDALDGCEYILQLINSGGNGRHGGGA